jgi:predicted nucleic acid-binding protein
MVVSNTSPLNYLVLIDQIHLLSALYGRVLVPKSVHEELRAPETPEAVRSWVNSLPQWLEIASEVPVADSNLSELHQGERDAIALAQHLRADALVIDERRGRQEAESRGLIVIGTLGVLTAAQERGLVDLAKAIDLLRQTSFHASPKLLAMILERL